MLTAPFGSVRSPHSMVASADQLATQAGMQMLADGGNAVDAAIATNAAIAVTSPHLCGLGGDLLALIHQGDGPPIVMNASGRAGSGADAEALREAGFTEMPFRHDIRAVTMPGCVDGWVALHRRFGSRPLAELLAPAIELAEQGFPASPQLVGTLATLDPRAREAFHELLVQALRPGARVTRPGVGRTLRAIAATGRGGFYEGAFGEGLLELGQGWYAPADLERPQADWVEALGLDVWGHRLWTVPPNSQGYLTLAGAAVAAGLDLPADPDDPRWAHLLVEAAVAVGRDRPDVLWEGADGASLLSAERLAARRASIGERATNGTVPAADGDTTYLCVVDDQRMGVSLIQSNAAGFGSWLVEPRTGINLHNRGMAFSVTAGHPAELGPGRRPPHTLSPALITRSEGSLAAVFGTMGGDAQPQILLQILTRLLLHEDTPGSAIGAGRWVLRGPATGFHTWTGAERVVVVEGHAPTDWLSGLAARGHSVERIGPWHPDAVGHAHAIVVEAGGFLAGAADPRTRVGSCAGR